MPARMCEGISVFSYYTTRPHMRSLDQDALPRTRNRIYSGASSTTLTLPSIQLQRSRRGYLLWLIPFRSLLSGTLENQHRGLCYDLSVLENPSIREGSDQNSRLGQHYVLTRYGDWTSKEVLAIIYAGPAGWRHHHVLRLARKRQQHLKRVVSCCWREVTKHDFMTGCTRECRPAALHYLRLDTL